MTFSAGPAVLRAALLLAASSAVIHAEFPRALFSGGEAGPYGARLVPRSYSLYNSYPAAPYDGQYGGVGSGFSNTGGGYGGYNTGYSAGYNSGYSTGDDYGSSYIGTTGGTVASSEYSVNTPTSALRSHSVHATAPAGDYQENGVGGGYGSTDSSSQYRYHVSDPSTGDAKSQHETRHGDSVSGEYRVLEANGLMRVVSYTADDAHGFVANVRWEPAERPHGAAVSHQEVSQQHAH